MKYNIWEQQGKPTFYNPLPTGWGNNIKLPVIQNMDVTVRFKAKSASGSRLRVTDTGGVSLSRTFVLKPDFENFELTWFQKQNDTGIFCFYDDTNPTGNGDIIMEDIELVEESMGVSTINGIDGFLSGKWTIHPTAKVIDDETIEINAPDVGFLESTITIPCEPSTPYILKVEATSGSGSIVTPLTKTLSALPNISGGAFINGAFTTPADAYFLKLRVMSNKVGTFTVKRLTLQMGDVQYPYSKKTGERMVLPVPDNVLKVEESEWVQGSRNSSNVITAQTVRITSKGIIDLEANKTYYLNANPGYKFAYFLFDGNGVLVSSSAWLTELTKIETGDTIKKITLNLARTNDTTINPKDVVLVRPMLYVDFGRNKIPIPGGTSGKNMFYGYEDGYLNSGTFNEKPLSGSNGQRTTLWMVCEPGVKYALSGGDRSSWHFKNANGVIFAGLVGSDFGGVITPPDGAVLMRVYYSSNGTHEFPQIEKNDVSNYEKPMTIPKKAMKIPKKNLVKEDTVILDAPSSVNIIHDEAIKLEIGKTYTLSAIIPTGVIMQPRKDYTGLVYQNMNGNGSKISLTFVATHEVLVIRKYTNSVIGLFTVSEIQLEEGIVNSTFEKLTMVNKKPLKGFDLNGYSDFLYMSHRNVTTFDVTVRFIMGKETRGAYKMLWGASNHATYIGVRPGMKNIFCSLVVGGLQSTYPIANVYVTTDNVHEIRMSYDKQFVRIWFDGLLVATYSETRDVVPFPASYFGRYTGVGAYYHDSIIQYVKMDGVFEFDFTDPTKLKGNKFLGKNGEFADLIGAPVQYPRLAKR